MSIDVSSQTSERLLETLMEITNMTRVRRAGWLMAGVPEAETISDHCFETAVIAALLSSHIDEKVDMRKVLMMALFHEIGEVRMTDLPRRASPYVKAFKRKAEHEAAIDVLDGTSGEILELLTEAEEKKTPEARLFEAAEELQIIFKALVYAKENRGDMSEYRRDVAKYDSEGFDIADRVRNQIREKLEYYLGGREAWEIGYRRKKPTD
jgi:5'-deoxynucleotidase YfbR-like HD superfamily hydrolase